MKYLLIALTLLLTSPTSATEIYLGFGTPYREDHPGSDIYSLSVTHNDWKFKYEDWPDHMLSLFNTDKHPNWPRRKIKGHSMFSVSRNIYKYNFSNQCNFYFDFGVAYTTNISAATSSALLFHEAVGYQCEWWGAGINHRSNARIKGQNVGEDGAFVNFLLWKG